MRKRVHTKVDRSTTTRPIDVLTAMHRLLKISQPIEAYTNTFRLDRECEWYRLVWHFCIPKCIPQWKIPMAAIHERTRTRTTAGKFESTSETYSIPLHVYFTNELIDELAKITSTDNTHSWKKPLSATLLVDNYRVAIAESKSRVLYPIFFVLSRKTISPTLFERWNPI